MALLIVRYAGVFRWGYNTSGDLVHWPCRTMAMPSSVLVHWYYRIIVFCACRIITMSSGVLVHWPCRIMATQNHGPAKNHSGVLFWPCGIIALLIVRYTGVFRWGYNTSGDLVHWPCRIMAFCACRIIAMPSGVLVHWPCRIMATQNHGLAKNHSGVLF
jgi:hypothetical protein